MLAFNPGALILQDGAIFEGCSVGTEGITCGEVVFNTSHTGYQEILTDPSYTQQLIVFTQPHIGNVGVNEDDMESATVHAKGMIMRSFSASYSNWRGQESLHNFIFRNKLFALSEIDTRALTQHLRAKGSQLGCLISSQVNYELAEIYLKNTPKMEGCDLAKTVTTQEMYSLKPNDKTRFHVIVMDFGVKKSILNALLARGCAITVVPAQTPAAAILSLHPEAILLSNGPGDPAACDYAIAAIKELMMHKIPMMAICLGHQLLALACGAKTKKMAFGHHGANHPIKSLYNGQVAISSQNHGFVVADEDLPPCLQVTHRSLFDGTIAGIECTDLPVFGFQGHPEAGPGPLELTSLFDYFISLIEASHAKTL